MFLKQLNHYGKLHNILNRIRKMKMMSILLSLKILKLKHLLAKEYAILLIFMYSHCDLYAIYETQLIILAN